MKKTTILLFLLLTVFLVQIIVYIPSVKAIYQNFENDYTEVDTEDDRIQRSTVNIDHLATRNETTYVYRDFGVDYFGNWTHDVDARSDFRENDGLGVVWMVANDLGDYRSLYLAGKTLLIVRFYRTVGTNYIQLFELFDTNYYSQSFSGALASTWYYFVIEKSGVSLSCKIYYNSLRTDLVTTLSLTLQDDHSFRYIYGCNSYNDGNSYYFNNDIKNLDLHLSFSLTYYFNEGGQFRANNLTLTNGTTKT